MVYTRSVESPRMKHRHRVVFEVEDIYLPNEVELIKTERPFLRGKLY